MKKGKMTVLGIGAHPDDLEILCGGALAKYAMQGHRVYMCHVSTGNQGGKMAAKVSPEQMGRIRATEAEESARLIGATAVSLGFGDWGIFPEKESFARFSKLVRDVSPDIIITHAINDYMRDHTMTSHIVTSGPVNIPVYYMDTLAGVGFQPTEYVDISETMELKLRMLRKHKSQLAWIKLGHAADIVDLVKTTAKFRGFQCGVPYAEGFRKLDAWSGRNLTKRILP